MKHIFTVSIFTTIIGIFLCIGSVSAQEFSPIAKLAQDYILRLNKDLKENNDLVPSPKQKAVVVNPEAVVFNAITESIDTITRTTKEVKEEKDKVISNIKETVKNNIDESIVKIKQENIEKQAYELQATVDTERAELFESVSQKIESIKPINAEDEDKKIEELKGEIDDSLDKIQKKLEDTSGVPVTFEKSKRDVKESLLRFQEILEEKKTIVESRQGELVFKDTDGDGISDYDEIYLYKTDPEKARTKGEGKTDGEKIKEGINPLSDIEERVQYQDPREDKESFVSESYKLEKIALLREQKVLTFEGSALPNTYVTLYIYSTPVVVTIKTDDQGKWSYQLDKELEDGEHQMYVASVDNSGKIVARSNPILFTKSAEAATIGIAGSIDSSVHTQDFLKDNFILITLGALIAIVVLGMMFVGNHKTIGSAIAELKGHVNSK